MSALLLFFLLNDLSWPGPYADQPYHNKTLLVEDWLGSYFHSRYSQPQNLVTFEFCEKEKSATSIFQGCKLLGQVPYDKLDKFQEPILETIKNYRREVADVADSSFWYFLSGGARKSGNVKALDQVIKAIETEGLSNWVLLPKGELPNLPALTTPIVMDELMDRIRRRLYYPLELPDECLRNDEILQGL